MTLDSAAARGSRPLWIRNAAPAERSTRVVATNALAAALTLGGSFLNFLNYNGYPVFSKEVGLVLAGILAAALLIGLCAAALGTLGRIFIPTFLVILAIDVNSDNVLLLLAAGIASTFFAKFARHALILLFGVVTVTQMAIAITGSTGAGTASAGNAASVQAAKSQPEIALVHVILDEHIGLDGIPDSLPRGPRMREQLRRFYVENGFRILAGAYSESLHTVNAIPRALSLGTPSAWQKGGRDGMTLRRNPYFDALQAMGFSVDVAQSDWIDYCDHPVVARCVTRAGGGVIDVGDKLPAPDKAVILVYRFSALSVLAERAFDGFDQIAQHGRRFGYSLPLVEIKKRTKTSPLIGMATFEDVIRSARSLTPGKAIFAHVLLPHFPYAYDEGCNLRGVSDWLGRASATARQTRYDAYFDQLTCVTTKIGELLSTVASSPAAGKTVFIIHGDHGSRIMDVEPVIENDGTFSDRDLVDGYAAFFAVAAPGIEPGYDVGRYPLRLILDALVQSRFRTAAPDLPDGFTPTIMIENGGWNPVTERPVGDLDWWNGGR
ncbi:MAG TPA: hypothetical protein VGF43_03910 [Dongiaceae bacterium]|jgi:hypothetical protein